MHQASCHRPGTKMKYPGTLGVAHPRVPGARKVFCSADYNSNLAWSSRESDLLLLEKFSVLLYEGSPVGRNGELIKDGIDRTYRLAISAIDTIVRVDIV